MILYLILISLYINFSIQKIIKNGVYNIAIGQYYLCFTHGKIRISDFFRYPDSFFRFKKISKNKNETFYHIEEIFTNYQMSYLENKELNFNYTSNISKEWEIREINNNSFIFKNKDNCWIKIINNNIICDDIIPYYEATQFRINKIYFETEEENNYINNELLNNEPIDVLIKYIDLKDQNLTRNGIHQIEKDYDNEELRYSVRSILENIPWIRKIYILMPNEKVRYFKDYNFIKEKIIYVKDKDFLGYDSSNFNAFLFRYWKMKEFGISDNFIIMDDDYFIGNKLEKNDFFYVKEGKVVPSIVTSHFLKIEKISVQKYVRIYKEKAKNSKEEQNDDIFNYSKFLTFSFILNLFNFTLNESIFLPKFTHNAIPVNLADIKEVYDFAYKSDYKYTTLDCLYRHYEYLQFQIMILSYTFLKYDRRIKNIPYKFIRITDTFSGNYNSSLFCINKGPWTYSNLDYYKQKILMEYLFPNPSPYEIIDYSFLNLTYNVIFTMEKKIKIYEKKILELIKRKDPKLKYNYNDYEKVIFLLVFIIIFKINYRIKFFNNYSYT